MKLLRLIPLVICIAVGVFSNQDVFAGQDGGDNRIILDISTNTPEGLQSSYDSEVGVSLIYSRKITDHFELGVSALDVFLASNANFYAFALNPAYYQDLGEFHVYIGPSVGTLRAYENVYPIGHIEASAFALGAFIGSDFMITDHFLMNANIHYLASPHSNSLSVLNLALGFGFKF
jgi:hypothetical protein